MSKPAAQTPAKPKEHVDGQVTNLASEFFVAAELLKRDIQTSVTFGNAKAIDLFAYNPRTKRSFTVQVKGLRSGHNYFLISAAKIDPSSVYVFVLVNKPGQPVDYFIVPGRDLQDASRFKGYDHPTLPGIHPKDLVSFRDNWAVFEEVYETAPAISTLEVCSAPLPRTKKAQ